MDDGDWSRFDKYPENTCYCRCGAIFRSHSRYSITRGLISRKPCPVCQQTDGLHKSSSDPEEFVVKKE